MPAELSGVDRHTVAGATMHRKSVRAFLDTPVDNDLIVQLLETASNETTSRGRMQGWSPAPRSTGACARRRCQSSLGPRRS